MYLKPNWRVLTIGDGDLTFSYSQKKYHPLQSITASVLDDKYTLSEKYLKNGIAGLESFKSEIIYQLDVTNKQTWPLKLSGQIDLVIFQFPLVPAAKNYTEYQQGMNQNLVNRHLLYRYLRACFTTILDPNGARLAYITSKEVKPYSHWQIETDLTRDSEITYIGKQSFIYADFPEYQIRNVDRDKQVKDTKGFIYAYSDKKENNEIAASFTGFKYSQENHCPLCRVGPFTSEENRERHLLSRKHQKLAGYQIDWFEFLKRIENEDR